MIPDNLLKKPGVYLFKNKKGKILYIGKASNLKERVKQHRVLLKRAERLDYIETDSEIEALILEANLIKKYQPKYNIAWRDDKNYFYVGITKEDFPRVFITHQIQKEESGSHAIGPFIDGQALKQTLKILRKIFTYRTCKNPLPKHPCLWYQLGRCPAPCMPRLNNIKLKKECQENVKNLIKILRGKKTQVLKDLKKEMQKLSKTQNFEQAAKIRDQISALERVLQHAKIFDSVEARLQPGFRPGIRIEAYDISNIQGQQACGAMVTFIDGKPNKNFYRKFKIKMSGKPNDVAMLKECLIRRFKHPEWGWPDLILIDGGIAQLNAAAQCLKSSFKHIDIIALAKKKNKLFLKNQKRPILLKTLPREILNLILQLRDEAHRFASNYHRKLREIDFRPNN